MFPVALSVLHRQLLCLRRKCQLLWCLWEYVVLIYLLMTKTGSSFKKRNLRNYFSFFFLIKTMFWENSTSIIGLLWQFHTGLLLECNYSNLDNGLLYNKTIDVRFIYKSNTLGFIFLTSKWRSRTSSSSQMCWALKPFPQRKSY